MTLIELFLSQKFFYMMQIVPTSSTTSTMRYEVYRRKGIDAEEVKKEIDFYYQVEGEDKWLANGAQSNLNAGPYVAGPLHPELEEGVAYTEQIIRDLVQKHADQEKKEGRQIWPATRQMRGKQVEEDEALCRGICETTNGGGQQLLAW